MQRCIVMLMSMLFGLTSAAFADFYIVASGKRAKKTLLVSPKSTSEASGAALLAVMDEIRDNNATNPYLVIIEPGVYNIGSSPLNMKSYVDVQGSGRGVTTIKGLQNISESGIVVMADNSAIRDLAIVLTAGGESNVVRGIWADKATCEIENMLIDVSDVEYGFGISAVGASWTEYDVHVDNVIVKISNAATRGYGITFEQFVRATLRNFIIDLQSDSVVGEGFGIYNGYDSIVDIRDGSISVSGYGNNCGVLNFAAGSHVLLRDIEMEITSPGTTHYGVTVMYEASLDMMGVKIYSVGDGVFVHSYGPAYIALVRIVHSWIKGSYKSVEVGDFANTYLGQNLLQGGVAFGSGGSTASSFNCVDNFDENMAAVSCP